MSNEERILEMLAAIQHQMAGMQSQIGCVQLKIEELRKDVQKNSRRIDGVEHEIKVLRSETTGMHEKLDDLTEAHEDTHAGVNGLLEWSEKVRSIKSLQIPSV